MRLICQILSDSHNHPELRIDCGWMTFKIQSMTLNLNLNEKGFEISGFCQILSDSHNHPELRIDYCLKVVGEWLLKFSQWIPSQLVVLQVKTCVSVAVLLATLLIHDFQFQSEKIIKKFKGMLNQPHKLHPLLKFCP
jgi:hypothetical protein